MTPADRLFNHRVPNLRPRSESGRSGRSLQALALEMEQAAFQLRREAVAAVVEQRRIREEALVARRLADAVECRAALALDEGDEFLARQILARDMCTLKSREALERELTEATRRLTELVKSLAQVGDQARLTRHRREELKERGRGC